MRIGAIEKLVAPNFLGNEVSLIETPVKRGVPGGEPFQWQPGQSGNPAGRPKSARHKINEQFLKDFQKEWEASGAAVLKVAATEHPVEFMRAAISLLPKEVHLHDMPLEDVSDDELVGLIDEIRSAKARLVGAESSAGTGSKKRKATTRIISHNVR